MLTKRDRSTLTLALNNIQGVINSLQIISPRELRGVSDGDDDDYNAVVKKAELVRTCLEVTLNQTRKPTQAEVEELNT